MYNENQVSGAYGTANGLIGSGIGSGYGPAATTKPMSVIEASLNRLRSANNSLIDAIDILESRLSPILSTTLPTNQTDLDPINKYPQEENMSLAGEIEKQQRKVLIALRKVSEITQKLEV